MTNSETIEKLNSALTQLIDAYEILQDKNRDLENEIKQKNENIYNLENKLSDANGHTEVQSNKMDSMLSRIQNLLKSDSKIEDEKEVIQNSIFNQNNDDDEEIDLKIETETKTETKSETLKEEKSILEKDNKSYSNNNKIDLGRMESLLNGLNSK